MKKNIAIWIIISIRDYQYAKRRLFIQIWILHVQTFDRGFLTCCLFQPRNMPIIRRSHRLQTLISVVVTLSKPWIFVKLYWLLLQHWLNHPINSNTYITPKNINKKRNYFTEALFKINVTYAIKSYRIVGERNILVP